MLNIKIYNEATGVIVVQKKETLEVLVVPTVSKSFEASFSNFSFRDAKEQLGDNFSWSYNLIGCVPKDLAYSTCPSEYNWLE